MALPIGFKIKKLLSNYVKASRYLAVFLVPRAIAPGLNILQAKTTGNQLLWEQGVEKLWQITPLERRFLFHLWFPGIGGYVAQAFEKYRYQQYGVGPNRKSFRNPEYIEKTVAASARFIIRALEILIYPATIKWYVKSAHLFRDRYWDNSEIVGVVAAPALDQDTKIRELVNRIIEGQEKDITISKMIPMSLIYSQDPSNDELTFKLLSMAGIYEGLRQTMFENFDEVSLSKFKRMVEYIRQNKLQRFSSLVRAVDVWYGFGFVSQKQSTITVILDKTIEYLDNKAKCQQIINNNKSTWLEVHLALWNLGFIDVKDAIVVAQSILKSDKWEKRYLAAYFLSYVATPESLLILGDLLTDPDIRIAIQAYYGFINYIDFNNRISQSMFDSLEKFASRLEDSNYEIQNVLWKWNRLRLGRQAAFDTLVRFKNIIPEEKLMEYFPKYSSNQKRHLLYSLERNGSTLSANRHFWLGLLKDKSSDLRKIAQEKCSELGIIQADWPLLVEALRNYKDVKLWINNEVVKWDKESQKKFLELLTDNSEIKQKIANSIEVKKKSWWQKFQELFIDQRAVDQYQEKLALIYDRDQRSKPWQPKKSWLGRPYSINSHAIVKSLVGLINHHRNQEIKVTREWDSSQVNTTFLESVHYLPSYLGRNNFQRLSNLDEFPLAEVWEKWWQEQKQKYGSNITWELLVAYYSTPANFRDKEKTLTLRVLEYLIVKNIQASEIKKLLDNLESLYASIPKSKLNLVTIRQNQYQNKEVYCWKVDEKLLAWEKYIKNIIFSRPKIVTDEDYRRFWGLLRFKDEPTISTPYYARCLPEGEFLMEAYDRGIATVQDIADALLARRGLLNNKNRSYFWGKLEEKNGNWTDLEFFKPSTVNAILDKFPKLQPVFQKWWDFLAEDLIAPDDLNNPYRAAGATLKYVQGAQHLFKVLAKVSSDDLKRRNYYWVSTKDKYDAISNFIRVSYPSQTDTPILIKKLIDQSGVSEELLYSVLLFAPQWSGIVESALKKEGLASAVWWIVAHCKDTRWSVPQDLRDDWRELVKKQTEISPEDLGEGAVDVDWFLKSYQAIGAKTWNKLYDLAKFSSTSIGHNRAKLFADALLGHLKVGVVKKEITDKRNQDKLRALGLIPLKDKTKEKELMDRYSFIMEFQKQSKQFGSQRQASEKLAARISLANLARNAGYQDETRMIWSLEGQKAKNIEAMDNKEIRNQVRVIKNSLEKAMLDGTKFTGKELVGYQHHPLLKDFISYLVWQDKNNKKLVTNKFVDNHDYKLAHSWDLLESGEWSKWQHWAFEQKLVQPFKQIFRELYVMSEDEKNEGSQSKRFAGHQVKLKQALVLFRARGWSTTYEGSIYKRINKEGITVSVLTENGYLTPGEVEGPVIEGIIFTNNLKGERVKLDKISPVVFSEVMRDVDLVVSVAHEGGQIPEPSTSTIQMRATLVRETSTLLGLNNVEIQKHFAIIKGEYGEYAVNLGSGVIHKRPGSMVFILPVHSQHRGRVFLPFADEDPKSAEILTKIITLANDSQIKDPNILQQIREV